MGIPHVASMVSKQHLSVFWDYDSCRADHIFPTIVNLRTILLEGLVDSFRVYADIATLDREERILLQLAGVSVIDTPSHKNSDDQSDDAVQHVMNTDLLLHALTETASSGAVVVSAHPCFAYPISMLKLRGYDCTVVSPSTSHLTALLDFLGPTIIDWDACNASGEQGKEPHQRPSCKVGAWIRPSGADESTPMESESTITLSPPVIPSPLPSDHREWSSPTMSAQSFPRSPFHAPVYGAAASERSESSFESVHRSQAASPALTQISSFNTTPRAGATPAPYSAIRPPTPGLRTVSAPASVQQTSSPRSQASEYSSPDSEPEHEIAQPTPVPAAPPVFSVIQDRPVPPPPVMPAVQHRPPPPPPPVAKPQPPSPSPPTPKAPVIEPKPVSPLPPLSKLPNTAAPPKPASTGPAPTIPAIFAPILIVVATFCHCLEYVIDRSILGTHLKTFRGRVEGQQYDYVQDGDVYKRAAATGFAEYIQRAVDAGVVTAWKVGDEAWVGLTDHAKASAAKLRMASPTSTTASTSASASSNTASQPTASTSSSMQRPAVAPIEFKPLVLALNELLKDGYTRPTRSDLGQSKHLGASVYAKAGVTRFSAYIDKAVQAGVVILGGKGATAWVQLNPT
ncbi:hypothetical protein CYLTODRAFT_492631 [Cylindrobasidium torrendii FP15055 ss-10]|uniref:NYN domain-containing protein n=1 Tax=Cylindrobasidium torrendii FP15055 ss-10 TaxID=1314674 RepID=A0A0D7B4C3_9AGAR|nr:hypothetical protein CYLTODRAFT_492631 [Cylindrobasidium torrendii FP15055 ss-10]